jgi:hypothetical protein
VIYLDESTKHLHANINAELLKKLKLLAVKREKPINKLLEEILKEYLQDK